MKLRLEVDLSTFTRPPMAYGEWTTIDGKAVRTMVQHTLFDMPWELGANRPIRDNAGNRIGFVAITEGGGE